MSYLEVEFVWQVRWQPQATGMVESMATAIEEPVITFKVLDIVATTWLAPVVALVEQLFEQLAKQLVATLVEIIGRQAIEQAATRLAFEELK